MQGEYVVNYMLNGKLYSAPARLNHDAWQLNMNDGRTWYIVKVCGNLAMVPGAFPPLPPSRLRRLPHLPSSPTGREITTRTCLWAVHPSWSATIRPINFDWGYGSPAPFIPYDNFSVRWTRVQYFDGGSYRFFLRVDDGGRVWVDDQLVIDQWHDSGPVTYAADMWLAPGPHNLRVEYYEHVGYALAQFSWQRMEVSYPDWKGEYWANPDLGGAPVLTRNDPWIDFNWGSGSPAPNLPPDNFSARWTRQLGFGSGNYRFFVRVDDGARLWIDGQLIIDQWHDSGAVTYSADRFINGGDHDLRLEYYDRAGGAEAHLWWERVDVSFPDWKGEYFNNRHVDGSPAYVRNDHDIDFDWGATARSGHPVRELLGSLDARAGLQQDQNVSLLRGG